MGGTGLRLRCVSNEHGVSFRRTNQGNRASNARPGRILFARGARLTWYTLSSKHLTAFRWDE